MSVILAFSAAALMVAGPAEATGPAGSPTVRVRQGSLAGSVVAGVDRFAGVPYAAPPVGALRWQPPKPAPAWTGVRGATAFGSQCPQATGGVEDCLYLNVYTPPDAAAGRNLPVMVYLPGGAFVVGAGSDYDPTPLVTRGDVVVVTINYRLGLLGALALPGLDAEAGPAGSGAYGLLDQQAALSWVRQNIRAFGGDDRNVTLFGESAGATYTCLNVASPTAAGLFDAGISESGCGLPTTPMAKAQQFGLALAHQLGCTTADGAADIACLRSKSSDAVNAAAAAVGGNPSAVQLASIPAVGGGALPLSVDAAFQQRKVNKVPLVIGTNANEGRLFVYGQVSGPIPTDQASYLATLQIVVTSTFGVPAATVAAEYPLANYSSPAEAVSAVIGDSSFSCNSLREDGLAAAAGVRLFGYEFTEPHASPLGASHGSELPYLFAMPATAQFDATQRNLANQMIDYWTSIARTHQPNRPGLPVWPPYSPATVLQNIAAGAIGPVSTATFAQNHHCDFWKNVT
ncbi:carboxylesterase family protein [Frankia sp. AiPs1]|uniref:carboxylesterase/lipase family protein n=1 Tax=Frankia sp. AiPs1 TaxID=573493 RepID=UPI00204490F1|nr:carboxylesterase family protein [Frankia sp. AiPs1]MCM3920183.1 carboxylesterase family protein [Frankia sp. AiPs1]